MFIYSISILLEKSIKLEYDRIDQLTMSDGGITAIAWYGYNLPADTPTVVIMHTITGTPESMRELVRDLNHIQAGELHYAFAVVTQVCQCLCHKFLFLVLLVI